MLNDKKQRLFSVWQIQVSAIYFCFSRKFHIFLLRLWWWYFQKQSDIQMSIFFVCFFLVHFRKLKMSHSHFHRSRHSCPTFKELVVFFFWRLHIVRKEKLDCFKFYGKFSKQMFKGEEKIFRLPFWINELYKSKVGWKKFLGFF